MNKIILIGGSPTAGKSYTARKLAEELKLPWISTDLIRELMKETVRKEDYKEIFNHPQVHGTSKGAVKFLTQNTAKQIVAHQNRESKDVWKGVEGLIKTDYVWGSFIIEGVTILPKFINKIKTNKKIVALFLIDDNIERTRKTIYTRGLWDDADKYPDYVKEKEVEWILEFNDYIKKEARKYGFPVIKIGDREQYINEIKKLIK